MLFESYLVTFVYQLLNKYSQTKTMFLNFGLCLQVLLHIQYNQLQDKMIPATWQGFACELRNLT